MGIKSTLVVPSIVASGTGGGGSVKTDTLLSITTAPSGTFEAGSKYYNSTTKKIYTATSANTWENATESDPEFGTYYTYNNQTYVWDGNSLELFELEDYQPKLVSGENIKTVNGNTLLGSGDLAIKTYQSYPANWPTTTTFSAFLNAINSDNTATAGMAYMGDLKCSGLPSELPNNANVEAIVEIMNSTTNSKAIHVTITSGTTSPYRWEYTYWNNGSNVSGWKGFLPMPQYLWYKGNVGTTITIADTSNASLVLVYKNGVLLEPPTEDSDSDLEINDYSISGTTLTLASALNADDKITIAIF